MAQTPSTREFVAALRRDPEREWSARDMAGALGVSEAAIYAHLRVLREEEEGVPAATGTPSGASEGSR